MLPVADAGVPVEYMAKKGMAVVCFVLTRDTFEAVVPHYSVGLRHEVERLGKRVKRIRDNQRHYWEVSFWSERQKACAVLKSAFARTAELCCLCRSSYSLAFPTRYSIGREIPTA